jgi:acyl dehydratase
MTSESKVETLVTKDMEERKGVWGDERTAPPVSESDIRKWGIASYWPEKPPRVFWDEAYAKGTRWGGIIAPNDFNPFAWPIDRAAPAAGRASAAGAGVGTRGMNGGQVETFGVPMRPGDVITARTRLKDWNERTTRLGLTLFTNTETEWRNQKGEHVKTRISTGIRY